MICTVRVAIKNLLIKINWDSFCIRNILIVIFEFPDHFHLFIGAVAGDIWSANCLIRQHSLRPLYVGRILNLIRCVLLYAKYVRYVCVCTSRTVIRIHCYYCYCCFFSSQCTCVLVVECMCSHSMLCILRSFFSFKFSLSLSSALVGCVWVFVCLIVCTVYACVYLLLFWYEYAPGPFHFDSPHLSVCIDIFFPSSNHWTAASAAAAAVVVQVMCDYLLFSLSITLPCLLTCSLAHPFVTFEFFLCLSPYHSIKREYSP